MAVYTRDALSCPYSRLKDPLAPLAEAARMQCALSIAGRLASSLCSIAQMRGGTTLDDASPARTSRRRVRPEAYKPVQQLCGQGSPESARTQPPPVVKESASP